MHHKSKGYRGPGAVAEGLFGPASLALEQKAATWGALKFTLKTLSFHGAVEVRLCAMLEPWQSRALGNTQEHDIHRGDTLCGHPLHV